MLSSWMITSSFFIFPGNFTHSCLYNYLDNSDNKSVKATSLPRTAGEDTQSSLLRPPVYHHCCHHQYHQVKYHLHHSVEHHQHNYFSIITKYYRTSSRIIIMAPDSSIKTWVTITGLIGFNIRKLCQCHHHWASWLRYQQLSHCHDRSVDCISVKWVIIISGRLTWTLSSEPF